MSGHTHTLPPDFFGKHRTILWSIVTILLSMATVAAEDTCHESQCGKPSDTMVSNRADRYIIIVRHAERIDNTFGRDWYDKAFSTDGSYRRLDLNFPASLPSRQGGPSAYWEDTSVTELGWYQARITGEALSDAGIHVDHVYSSPGLRCIQTATGLLQGLGQNHPISVDTALYEWFGFYKEIGMPTWLSKPEEYQDFNLKVNSDYVPMLLQDDRDTSESLDEYYKRSHLFMKNILKQHSSGNILLVAHGGSLDGLTRGIRGLGPRTREKFSDIFKGVPYCGVGVLAQHDDAWELVQPPTLPFTHGQNKPYDWTIVRD